MSPETRTAAMTRPHILTALFLVVWLILLAIPLPDFAVPYKIQVDVFIICIMSTCGNGVLEAYKVAFERFEPENSLEAKIANEQMKSLATFMNSVTVAIFAVYVLTRGEFTSSKEVAKAVLGLFAVFIMNRAARKILTAMKNESV